MADMGNPMKNDYNGYNQDFLTTLSSFTTSTTELRDVVKALKDTLTNFDKSVTDNTKSQRKLFDRTKTTYQNRDKKDTFSESSKIGKYRTEQEAAYRKSLEIIRNSSNTYEETQRILQQISHNIYSSFSDITVTTDNLNNSLKNVSTNNTDIVGMLEKSKNTLSDYEKSFLVLMKSTQQYDKSEQNLLKYQTLREKAALNEDDKYREKRLNLLDSLIQKEQERLQTNKVILDSENDYIRGMQAVRNREKELIEKDVQFRTDMSSKVNAFRPELAQKALGYKQNIQEFFNPKSSEQYKVTKEYFEKTRAELYQNKIDTVSQLSSLQAEESKITSDVSSKEQELAILKEQSELTKEDENKLKQEIELLKKQQKLVEKQIKLANKELKQLGEQEDFLDAQELSLENTSTTVVKVVDTATKALQKFITTAIDRHLSKIQDATDQVFESFESMQKSLGRQLKMTSGEYEDLKEQLIEAAEEEGLGIDVTQLNEAAVSIGEMGIRDSNLIKSMAVGMGRLSAVGINYNLDEETAKQLNAQYFKVRDEAIAQGVSEEAATKKAYEEILSEFDSMIAIETKIQAKYGDTIALQNGGWQEIKNWTNKLTATGDLDTAEEREQFQYGMADTLEMLTSAGMSNPTAILTDVESILNNTMSEQNAWITSWMKEQGYDTEKFYEQLSKDSGGTMQSMLDYLVDNVISGANATNQAYLKNAYGINSLTNEDIRSLTDKYAEAKAKAESKTDVESKELATYRDEQLKNIQEGSYLTATEQKEKEKIDDVASTVSELQDINDGKFWMDTGFSTLSGIINGAVNVGSTVLLSKLLGTGGSSGGLTNIIGKFLGKGGTAAAGTTGAGSATGELAGTAGTTGTTSGGAGAGALGAGLSSMLIYGGVAVAGASAVSNFAQADSFEEGLLNTLGDTTFTTGLGVTIGTAAGGPIGAVIGGVIGQVVPTIAEKSTEKALATITDPYEEAAEREAEQLKEAANKLSMAADAHINTAEKLKNEVEEQKEIFAQYSEDEKKDYLVRQGMAEEDVANLKDSAEINAKFNDAIKKWEDNLLKQSDNKQTLADQSNQFFNTFGKSFDVEDSTANQWTTNLDDANFTTGMFRPILGEAFNMASYDSTEDMVARAELLNKLGVADIDTEAFENGNGFSDKELAQQLNEAEQSLATKKSMRTEEGYDMIEKAKQYAKDTGSTGLSTEASVKKYAKAMGMDYTDEQLQAMGTEAKSMEEDKEAYEKANEEFHNKQTELLDNHPEITSYRELLDTYKKEYKFGEYSDEDKMLSLEKDYTKSADGDILIGGSTKVNTSNLFNLKHTGSGDNYDYSPQLYEGKYKTGLDYVPIDDYMALLHQGEMVLNETEAEAYRDNGSQLLHSLLGVEDVIDTIKYQFAYNNNSTNNPTTIDTSNITSSVDNQTTKLEALLTKILQVISSYGTSKSNLPKSLVNMNSNISLL